MSPARCSRPADLWKRACNRDDVHNCKLYRVRVDLDAGQIAEIQLAIDVTVDVSPQSANALMMFPAISPDRQRIAFEYRATGAGTGEIKACTLSDKQCVTASTGLTGGVGRWASWLSNTDLLFSLSGAGGAGWADVYRVTVAPQGVPQPTSDVSIILGASGVPAQRDTEGHAFEDGFGFTRDGVKHIASHGNYPNAPACRDGSGNVSTNQAQCVYHPSSVPSVWNVDQGIGYPVSLKMTVIEDPWACAHVAASPDGTRVLCTVQETYADPEHMSAELVYGDPYTTLVDANGDAVPETRVKQYVTFEFHFDAGQNAYVSTTGREMFTHHGPAQLEGLDARFKQTACASPTKAIYLHKYTEYCADSNHIVTTVWCQGQTSLGDQEDDYPSQVVHSAVVLIDLTDRSYPKYVNLTAAIESWQGGQSPSLANFMGASGTCATVVTD
jgi:hypothetical protein